MVKQPKRGKVKKIEHVQGTGLGLDFCDECPFLGYKDGGVPYCNTNDKVLTTDNDGYVVVPDWCGNKKNDEKNI